MEALQLLLPEQAEQKSASARESALASEKSKLADDLVRACKAHEAMKVKRTDEKLHHPNPAGRNTR